MARKTGIRVSINPTLLQDALSQGKNGVVVSREIHTSIQQDFSQKQKELIALFYKHPISQEILGGSRASNISGTLGGYGNLFAFLGFPDGDNPLSNIEQVFAKKMEYKVRGMRNGKFVITIYVPKPQDVFDETPMPWASGISWTESIEKGVGNLTAFLFNPSGFNASRSGAGLQVQNKNSGVNFKRTPYVSAILQEFKRELRKL